MIRFNDKSDGEKISTAAQLAYNPSTDVCIARVEDGELWGGVVYQGYTGASISIHMAGFNPRWVNKDMIWVAFHYPFVQLGCKKLFGQVGLHNQKALELDLRLGFKEEARIADVYPEGDMVLLSMRLEDCKWLSIKPTNIEG